MSNPNIFGSLSNNSGENLEFQRKQAIRQRGIKVNQVYAEFKDDVANIQDMLKSGRIDQAKANAFLKEVTEKREDKLAAISPEAKAQYDADLATIQEDLNKGKIDEAKANAWREDARDTYETRLSAVDNSPSVGEQTPALEPAPESAVDNSPSVGEQTPVSEPAPESGPTKKPDLLAPQKDDLDGRTFQAGPGLSKEDEFKRLTGEDWPGTTYYAESDGAEGSDDGTLESWTIRKRVSEKAPGKTELAEDIVDTFQTGLGLTKESEFKRLTGEDWPGVNYYAESNGADEGDDGPIENWVIKKRTTVEKTDGGKTEESPEVTELRREIEALREEVAALREALKPGDAPHSKRLSERGVTKGPKIKWWARTGEGTVPDEGPTPEEDEPTVEDEGSIPEEGEPTLGEGDGTTAEEERKGLLKRIINKAKKHESMVIAFTAATAVVATALFIGSRANNRNNQTNQTATEATANNDAEEDNVVPGFNPDFMNKYLYGYENKENVSNEVTYRGQFASEDGTTYNANKSSDHAFGESLKSGASEEEMKEDLINRQNQNGQLAATYFYMQEKTTDPSFGVEGAKFNNPDDLLEAMEANPDLRQRVYDYVKDTLTNNSLTEDEVKGKFHNFFLDSNFETGDVDTSNVDVVGCTTNEDGTKVYKISYEWTDADGNIHVDTFTFKEKCGGQPLDQIDFTTSVRQIPEEPEKPEPVKPTVTPKPTTTPTPVVTYEPPAPTLSPKNKDAENKNAGDDRVTPGKAGEKNSPEQDTANFKSIEKQKEDDARKKAAANSVASAQAEAERQALDEAAVRGIIDEVMSGTTKAEAERAADEAAKEAAKRQREEAEATARRRAERAAREAAQAEADRQATATEGQNTSTLNANERANLFNNGNF